MLKIKELLADPNRWTQHAPARDAEGACTLSFHPDAVKWCLSGALDHCYPDYQERHTIRRRLFKMAGRALYAFNDNATHHEVLKLVTDADV
jgi:hypothetical protein